MKNYLKLMRKILNEGSKKEDRTGTGTLSLFGEQLKFNLQDGFPLVTTKKVHLKSVIHELLWFLKGDSNIEYLKKNNITIWDEWADKNGDLGPVYGVQWRSWPTTSGKKIDQIANCVETLKNNPSSRRIIISSWNVADLDKMALAPCHAFFQFYVVNNTLSCQLYQRSADFFLGVPFNIASYSLLTIMLAQVCKLNPGNFILTFGDCHLYSNHIDQAKLQLLREPMDLPEVQINPSINNIFNFNYNDFNIINYNPMPAIKAPVSI